MIGKYAAALKKLFSLTVIYKLKMIRKDLNYQFFVTIKSLEEPRGTCMKEMRPRLFRVAKKMWNEWTLDLRDGQSQQVFLQQKFIP